MNRLYEWMKSAQDEIYLQNTFNDLTQMQLIPSCPQKCFHCDQLFETPQTCSICHEEKRVFGRLLFLTKRQYFLLTNITKQLLSHEPLPHLIIHTMQSYSSQFPYHVHRSACSFEFYWYNRCNNKEGAVINLLDSTFDNNFNIAHIVYEYHGGHWSFY